MKKKKVSCAALGTCIVELQDRVNLRNVDVYKALKIGHSVYNGLKKGAKSWHPVPPAMKPSRPAKKTTASPTAGA